MVHRRGSEDAEVHIRKGLTGGSVIASRGGVCAAVRLVPCGGPSVSVRGGSPFGASGPLRSRHRAGWHGRSGEGSGQAAYACGAGSRGVVDLPQDPRDLVGLRNTELPSCVEGKV